MIHEKKINMQLRQEVTTELELYVMKTNYTNKIFCYGLEVE